MEGREGTQRERALVTAEEQEVEEEVEEKGEEDVSGDGGEDE